MYWRTFLPLCLAEEQPRMAQQTNHLLAKRLWATIAASRELRHQNRLTIKRDTIYLKGIGKYKTQNKPVNKHSALKQPTLEQYTYIVT